jgi:hypothetical protein
MNTRDCVNALIKWTSENYDQLADYEYWDFVGEKRLMTLQKGHTRVSNWKRRAIKTDDDITFRLFDCTQSLFPSKMQFLVIETNGVVTDIIAGETSDFRSYFNKIGWNWGGWT